MAAPRVSGLYSWVTDLALFNEISASKIIDFSKVSLCVSENAVQGITRGLKQLQLWRDKLKTIVNDRTIIATTIGPSGLIKPDLNSFYAQIVKSIGRGKVISIYFPENTNFVGFIMSDPVAARQVRQEVDMVGGAPTCFIDERVPNEYQIRILWTPFDCSMSTVVDTISEYCNNVNISQERAFFDNGDTIATNIFSGSIVLKDELSIKDLPHVVKLKETVNSYVLLIIRGRSPLCLRCRMTGHIRSSCPSRVCSRCNFPHSPSISCTVKSYSSVLKKSSEFVSPLPRENDLTDYIKESEGFSLPSALHINPVKLLHPLDSDFGTPFNGNDISSSHVRDLNSDSDTVRDSPDLFRRVTRSMRNSIKINANKDVEMDSSTGFFDGLVDEMDQVGNSQVFSQNNSCLVMNSLESTNVSLEENNKLVQGKKEFKKISDFSKRSQIQDIGENGIKKKKLSDSVIIGGMVPVEVPDLGFLVPSDTPSDTQIALFTTSSENQETSQTPQSLTSVSFKVNLLDGLGEHMSQNVGTLNPDVLSDHVTASSNRLPIKKIYESFTDVAFMEDQDVQDSPSKVVHIHCTKCFKITKTTGDGRVKVHCTYCTALLRRHKDRRVYYTPGSGAKFFF